MNGYSPLYAPLKCSSYRIEKKIVDALLDADPPVEYPADLLAARRIIFVEQIDETKKSRPALQSGDGGQ